MRCFLILLLFFARASSALALDNGSSAVELLGVVPASQPAEGLGFVVPQDSNDWEFAAARAAGATYVRFQCSWDFVERQSEAPRNVSLGYRQDPNCVAGYASAKRYGLKPTVVAAFGPHSHRILDVTVPEGARAGATSITVQFASGERGSTFAQLSIPYDYLIGPDRTLLTASANYYGALITGVRPRDATHVVLTLASALKSDIPASTFITYTINEILYPSVNSWDPSDPSILAFCNYVQFLAEDMAKRGLSGEIEVWNEPPWSLDSWDARGYMYDRFPPGDVFSPNYGFAAALQRIRLPTGISLNWAGTEKSGSESLLFSESKTPRIVLSRSNRNFTSESFHPYDQTPERHMWTTGCLRATLKDPHNPVPYFSCYLSGEKVNSNMMWAVQYNMAAHVLDPSFDFHDSITETGSHPPAPGMRVQQARFNMRQFLGFEALGVSPVEFYSISDTTQTTDPNWSSVEPAGGQSYSPHASFTAFAGFMSDLRPIKTAPVGPTSVATLPSVSRYHGSYPLTTAHFVGSRLHAVRNSDMFVLWQRSHTPGCSSDGKHDAPSCNAEGSWMRQASPPPAPVSLHIPAGMHVTLMVNADTRVPVPYAVVGEEVTFSVTDDPIEVLVDPMGPPARDASDKRKRQ